MKRLSIAILVMIVFALAPSGKSAEAADFSFSVGFHDELSPYGSWVSYSNYGNVWRPHGYSGWRPYTDGYWGYTSYGPTWYGNEPYAPYVYHYGNWIYTARYGWIWVPGYDWHAGRVTWSYGGGYIGWRPQFPSGYYYPGSDYNFWVVIDSDRFGYRNYRPYALRSTVVRDLFARRVFRTRLDTFRRADLERVVRRPVRVLNLRERDVRIGDRRARLLVTSDDEVRIRKHVTQVRAKRDRDNDRRDDFRATSKSQQVRKSGDDRRAVVTKDKSSASSRKSFSKQELERGKKKPTEKAQKSNLYSRKSDRDKGSFKSSGSSRKSERSSKSTLYSRGKSDRDKGTVKRTSSGSSKKSYASSKRSGSKKSYASSKGSGSKKSYASSKGSSRKSYASSKGSSKKSYASSNRGSDRVKKASFSSRKSDSRGKDSRVSKAKNTSTKKATVKASGKKASSKKEKSHRKH